MFYAANFSQARNDTRIMKGTMKDTYISTTLSIWTITINPERQRTVRGIDFHCAKKNADWSSRGRDIVKL